LAFDATGYDIFAGIHGFLLLNYIKTLLVAPIT